MYTAFYGLTKHPFASTADPEFLYLSESHTQGLQHLQDTVREHTGVTVLSGDIGTGKTILLKTFIRSVGAPTHVAFVAHAGWSLPDTLRAVLHALHIRVHDKSPDALASSLRDYLSMCAALQEAVILILDEAQTLIPEVFEALHALVYPEHDKTQGLHLILSGQQVLGDQQQMSTIWRAVQHEYAPVHLQPLSYQDTQGYIATRLQIAQARAPLFPVAAVKQIYRASAGIPRVINTLCDAALLVGFGSRRREIGPDIITEVAKRLPVGTRGRSRHRVSSATPARCRVGGVASRITWPQGHDGPPTVRLIAAGLIVAGLLGSGMWWQRSSATPPTQAPALAARVQRKPVAQPVAAEEQQTFLLPVGALDTRAIPSVPPKASAPARAKVSQPSPVAAARFSKRRGQVVQQTTTVVPTKTGVHAQPQDKARPEHVPDALGILAAGTEVTVAGIAAPFAPQALEVVHPESHPGHQEVVAAGPRELPRSTPVPQESTPSTRERQGLKHTVSLQSMPEGATVLIDGKPAGRTPLTLQIEPGAHTVRLVKEGYQEMQNWIHLTGEGPSSFFQNLFYSGNGE